MAKKKDLHEPEKDELAGVFVSGRKLGFRSGQPLTTPVEIHTTVEMVMMKALNDFFKITCPKNFAFAERC